MPGQHEQGKAQYRRHGLEHQRAKRVLALCAPFLRGDFQLAPPCALLGIGVGGGDIGGIDAFRRGVGDGIHVGLLYPGALRISGEVAACGQALCAPALILKPSAYAFGSLVASQTTPSISFAVRKSLLGSGTCAAVAACLKTSMRLTCLATAR
ncbi:hypothetical protein D9M68_664190 [compost metagenome]